MNNFKKYFYLKNKIYKKMTININNMKIDVRKYH